MKPLFDRISPLLRHLILAVTPGVLVWVSSEFIPHLSAKGGQYAVIAGVLSILVLAVTPLTKQYGVGKGKS
jgi:hypothetical protein